MGALARAYDRYAFLGIGVALLALAAVAAGTGTSPGLAAAGAIGGPVLVAVHYGRAPYWAAYAATTVVAATIAGWYALGPGSSAVIGVAFAGAGVGSALRAVQFYRHGPPGS